MLTMSEILIRSSRELYILASVLIVSLTSITMILTLFIKNSKSYNTIVILMVSLAVGGILGQIFIHILPESTAEQGTLKTAVLVLFGIISFFVLEKCLLWRNLKNKNSIKTVGQMSLLADGIHNFMDGFIIGSAYLISVPLGIATTFAVCIHEVPLEIGEFCILIKSGFSKTQAILFNLASASTAVLGAFVAMYIGLSLNKTSDMIFAFVAGAYIYIVGFGLLPLLKNELKLSRVTRHFLAMGTGLGIMLLITVVK